MWSRTARRGTAGFLAACLAVAYGACGENASSVVTCTDGQCPSGHFCSDGRCIPFGDECLIDPDCPLDAVCDFGVCVSAAACDDCGDDQLCDPGGPHCIQADGDCSARPCPRDDANIAYVCAADRDCADVGLACGRFIDGYRACEPPPS